MNWLRFGNVNVLKTIVNETTINTTDVTKTFLTELNNTNAAKVDINQDIDLRIDQVKGCGLFEVSNNAESNVRAISKMSLEQISNLTNDIQAQMESDLTKVLNQKANALRRQLRIFDVNVTDDVTNIMKEVSNTINDTVENEINNRIEITSDNVQTIRVNIGTLESDGGDCIVSQNMVVDAVAESVSAGIAQQMLDSKAIVDSLNKYAVESDQEAGSDPADIISAIGDVVSAIFGPFQWLFIGIIVFIVGLIILAVVGGGEGDATQRRRQAKKESRKEVAPPPYSK